MRELFANSLCENAGFQVLNRKDDIWVLGRQKDENDAFEVFFIADINEEQGGETALDIFKAVKERSAAIDSDIRLHLMIITDKRIPEKLQDDDTVYDFLWILNTTDKCMKIVRSDTLAESNFKYIRSNGLNLLKNLFVDTMGKDAKDWKIA